MWIGSNASWAMCSALQSLVPMCHFEIWASSSMGKRNFFLLQGRRRGKGLSKSTVPPEVCLWNKINKASHVFSGSLVQQPNHIPESLNCLLDIGWFKQINTWYFCLLQKAHGWRSQPAHPLSSYFVIWQITQHISGHTRQSTMNKVVRCLHRSTWAFEEGPCCLLCSLVLSSHPAKRCGCHCSEQKVAMELKWRGLVGRYPHPSPNSVSVVFFIVCFRGGFVWLIVLGSIY